MPDKPKISNADEAGMKNALTERLKNLIDECGGNVKFTDKLNKVKTKGSTDVKLLENWTNPEKDIQLKTLYLIAAACNVSVDWLLGLSMEKYRSEKTFKCPVTYGDTLSLLNSLLKTDVISIAAPSYDRLILDTFADSSVTLPNHIQIRDTHLSNLIQDLYRAQELSKGQFADAWERTLKLEMKNPLKQHEGKPNHHYNDGESGQADCNKIAVPVKVLEHKALVGQVANQLNNLMKGLDYGKFGKKIGAKQSTVSGWFTKYLPKTYELYKIAKEYDVSADWILGLDKTSCTIIPWEEETHTYGSVLSMLKYLIEKGTIGFVEKYCGPKEGEENKYIPVFDDLLVIDDQFLFCLLLQQQILERYSTNVYKEMFEELFNKYKDAPLLPFNQDMRSDSGKILRNLWNGKINQDIDFDKLYEDLQKLSGSRLDKWHYKEP